MKIYSDPLPLSFVFFNLLLQFDIYVELSYFS